MKSSKKHPIRQQRCS